MIALRPVRAIAAAVALAFLAPSVASATPEPTATSAPAQENGNRPAYPMNGDAFAAYVDGYLSNLELSVERWLEGAGMKEDKKAAIRADFQTMAAQVRTAAGAATSDGTVTKDEANQVMRLAHTG